MNAHGTYVIERSGNVLRVVATGPFNWVALANYGKTYESMVNELLPADWAVLGIFQGESLFIPEAEEKLVEITRWRMQQKMKAVALVLNSSAAAQVVRAQVTRIYERAGANYALFDTESPAFEWLSEQGFDYDPNDAHLHVESYSS